jgi:hypothetical protein
LYGLTYWNIQCEPTAASLTNAQLCWTLIQMHRNLCICIIFNK